jgi:hypothetical protein
MVGDVLMYIVGRSKVVCSVVHLSTYRCPSGSFSCSGDGIQLAADITRRERHSKQFEERFAQLVDDS